MQLGEGAAGGGELVEPFDGFRCRDMRQHLLQVRSVGLPVLRNVQLGVDRVEDVVLGDLLPESSPIQRQDLVGDVVDATVPVFIGVARVGEVESGGVGVDLLVGPAGEELSTEPEKVEIGDGVNR